ncbi:cation transporter HKT8-like [Cucurbita pepo subsp. pepo]|uniref:cation transporter HKT8-like n=1 Tax=Cucurbita pepo subsp. pepo TaxID=3664 RepID=UPI000C9D90E2|nr:cation transporter HKT8-like [Cucurbita pepo subsp. pepo]
MSRMQRLSCFLIRVHPFWIHLFYFLFISSLGFLALLVLKPKTGSYHPFHPQNLDLFFTSVSAATVSSMSAVEMEAFSDPQLIVLSVLMFIGGEVFTSMVALQFRKFNLKFPDLKIASVPIDLEAKFDPPPPERLKYKSIKFLGFVVFGYLILSNFLGIVMVLIYLKLAPTARDVLKQKGLKTTTFSVFVVVSTFASCGFVPTNENMIVFRKNLGLLLVLIPQALLGNTLFPSCLRASIWGLGKVVKKKKLKIVGFLLENSEEIGFLHLLPKLDSWLLVGSVCGFVVVQVVAIGAMEWSSGALSGLNCGEKLVGILFLSVNSRHSGEAILDLSILSPAILVLFAAMMYLPPYTSFMPIKIDEGERRIKRAKFMDNFLFSQLFYLIIFVFIICVTERHNIKHDPLNFSLFNVIFEVISAYGNVGFSMGYSCKRQLYPSSVCVDKSFGFSGKWSDNGKLVLIVVMIFGRLKKFNMNKQRAWKLF